MPSFNPAIGLPGLLTASANLWHQWFYLEFQSRNRASRPSDHELLNMQWNLTVFQSRNRASMPSEGQVLVELEVYLLCFNPAIGLPGLLTNCTSLRMIG